MRDVLAELHKTEKRIVEMLEREDSRELRKVPQCVREVVKALDRAPGDSRNPAVRPRLVSLLVCVCPAAPASSGEHRCADGRPNTSGKRRVSTLDRPSCGRRKLQSHSQYIAPE